MSSPDNAILITETKLYVDHVEEEVLVGTLAEIVERDKGITTPGLGLNSDLDNVTSDLIFDTSGHYGSTISWDASAHSQIQDDGTVTQGGSDITANVIATILKYTASDTKTFSITVLQA